MIINSLLITFIKN